MRPLLCFPWTVKCHHEQEAVPALSSVVAAPRALQKGPVCPRLSGTAGNLSRPVFYLENAELSGKFDEEGCSCINVLLPGDLNAFSEQCRRSRDQGDNVQGSSSADHTWIF